MSANPTDARLHFKATRPQLGTVVEVLGPSNSDSEGLELALAKAGPSPIQLTAAGRESVLVILGGTCSVEAGGQSWSRLGTRENVFSGPAASVYVPPGQPCTIQSGSGADVAIIRAPAPDGGAAFAVTPDEVDVVTRGEGFFQRDVHNIIDKRHPAGSLLVGETFNIAGGWSSYPPHKHDVHDPPRQAKLQEIYFFKVDPGQGFGIQRMYSPERGFNTSVVVEDGDSVVIPFGYHPVVAAAGYRLYYLWALAGMGRDLNIVEDPAHAWVRTGQPVGAY